MASARGPEHRYREHLYTHVERGEATDGVERWLAEEIDAPSAIVLDRIAREERLEPADWQVLLRFFAASRVRTIGHLARRQLQWEQEIPKLIESTVRKTVNRLEQGERLERRSGHPLGGDLVEPPIRVRVREHADGSGGVLEAEILSGRKLFHAEMHRMITHTARHLRPHHWTILRAPRGEAWLTSDDPVIQAVISPERHVTFDAGWGVAGNYLMLPLSPRHLLFTRIGERPPLKYSVAERNVFDFAQRCTVAHAYRLIFGQSPQEWVAEGRPRRVDPMGIQREHNEWLKWHAAQSMAEQKLEDPSTWPSAHVV